MFQLVEDQGGEVDQREQGHDIRNQQVGNPAACDPTHHHGQSVPSPNQRHQLENIVGLLRKRRLAVVGDVQVGDRNEQEDEVVPQVVPFPFAEVETEEEIAHEDQADPQLNLQVGVVIVLCRIVEGFERQGGDDQHTAQQDQNI